MLHVAAVTAPTVPPVARLPPETTYYDLGLQCDPEHAQGRGSPGVDGHPGAARLSRRRPAYLRLPADRPPPGPARARKLPQACVRNSLTGDRGRDIVGRNNSPRGCRGLGADRGTSRMRPPSPLDCTRTCRARLRRGTEDRCSRSTIRPPYSSESTCGCARPCGWPPRPAARWRPRTRRGRVRPALPRPGVPAGARGLRGGMAGRGFQALGARARRRAARPSRRGRSGLQAGLRLPAGRRHPTAPERRARARPAVRDAGGPARGQGTIRTGRDAREA